jgi:DNA gyrase subunit A
VQERDELVFISQNGMVQRTGVSGISRYGRASQGVKVMNIRDDDVVSAVALVMETKADTSAAVAEELPTVDGDGPGIVPEDQLEGAEAGDIGADDASDAAHGGGASGPSPTEDED